MPESDFFTVNFTSRARLRGGQPGSCMGHQPIRSTKTSLKLSEIWF